MEGTFSFLRFCSGILKLSRKLYPNTTEILIFNSDICAPSLLHTNIIKDILPLHSSMHLFCLNEFWMKIHRQRFKALFSLFSLNLSCFNIACIKNLKARMVAPLMIGLLDGRNPRICCLILNFSKGEDKLICLSSPKLGDLIPQKNN